MIGEAPRNDAGPEPEQPEKEQPKPKQPENSADERKPEQSENSADEQPTPTSSEKRRRLKGKQPVQVPAPENPTPIVVRRSSVVLGEACGVSALEIRTLHRLGAPPILFWVLAVLLRLLGPPALDLDCVDWYSGVGEINASFQRRGLASLPFDVIHDPVYQDMTGTWGFITAIEWARRLKWFAFAPFGTVCSSWVWVCRSTSGRTPLRPLGDSGCHSVAQGNLMVARMMFLYMIIAAKKICFILEQPSSSMMNRHPKVAARNFHSIHTWMACFGAPTAKPSRLYSDTPLVADKMKRSMTASIKQRCSSAGVTTVKKGEGVLQNQVMGGKKLKETQCYTREYAEAVTEAWLGWRDQQPAQPFDNESDSESDIDGVDQEWDDAQLDPIVLALKGSR